MNDEELRTREFNRVFDAYLQTGRMTAGDYEKLTTLQMIVVQCVKRSFARHDRKTDTGAE